LAVGDIYLDENVSGKVTEVSLEAPIPVYEVHQRRYNPGAAGNAACNAASLGGQVIMLGVIGDDVNAGIVKREFEARKVDTSHIVVDPKSRHEHLRQAPRRRPQHPHAGSTPHRHAEAHAAYGRGGGKGRRQGP
jgi:bifunctional ADP-heptose synthase (sugar kinase/adenylyltransferase)